MTLLPRVTRTLGFSRVDTEHAFALAREIDGRRRDSVATAKEMHEFIAGYAEAAVLLDDEGSNVVRWNVFAGELFGLTSYSPAERNMLALMVGSKRMGSVLQIGPICNPEDRRCSIDVCPRIDPER